MCSACCGAYTVVASV
jgi:hypothetical protein